MVSLNKSQDILDFLLLLSNLSPNTTRRSQEWTTNAVDGCVFALYLDFQKIVIKAVKLLTLTIQSPFLQYSWIK